jgi:hypothetical protein
LKQSGTKSKNPNKKNAARCGGILETLWPLGNLCTQYGWCARTLRRDYAHSALADTYTPKRLTSQGPFGHSLVRWNHSMSDGKSQYP